MSFQKCINSWKIFLEMLTLIKKSRIAPTLNLIRSKMKERRIGPSTFSRTTLWKLLRTMGFTFKAIDRRVHLIEQPNIKLWRQRYIQRLNQNSANQNPRPVIYLDESWIGCNAVAVKGWVPKLMKSKRSKLDKQ